jgi:hypothetical protein
VDVEAFNGARTVCLHRIDVKTGQSANLPTRLLRITARIILPVGQRAIRDRSGSRVRTRHARASWGNPCEIRCARKTFASLGC